MLVKFLWLNDDQSLGAEIYVPMAIQSIDTVEDRQKAYDALARIVGEDNVTHCILC